MKPRLFMPAFAALASVGTVTQAAPVRPAELDAALKKLTEQYPGLAVHAEASGAAALYGRPMTAAPTPPEAAARWLAIHRGALGIPQLDLRLRRANNVHFGRFTVFAYRQLNKHIRISGASLCEGEHSQGHPFVSRGFF